MFVQAVVGTEQQYLLQGLDLPATSGLHFYFYFFVKVRLGYLLLIHSSWSWVS